VSRSTAAAALILMQANPEWPASAALDAIRPSAWPNLLILEFGDVLLGRNGEIVAAAGARLAGEAARGVFDYIAVHSSGFPYTGTIF
jgi:predicted protein tyrosine phosphatase